VFAPELRPDFRPRRSRRIRALVVCAMTLLLAACEIEDDLVIRADGSGTYRVRVSAEILASSIIDSVEARAEEAGFRIIDRGEAAGKKFIVVRKDFKDVAELRGEQSNFELTVDRPSLFRRRYRLRITVASVKSAQFDRRFTITMPATVTATTAGVEDGSHVTWFCSNGGTIEITAAGFAMPEARVSVAIGAGVAFLAAFVFFVRRARRSRAATSVAIAQIECSTCSRPMSRDARYCPACGDRVLDM
jgi:hypothetical protein